MPWIPRGFAHGIVTSRYPRRSDGYGAAFHGAVVVNQSHAEERATLEAAAEHCPTRAIGLGGSGVHLDRGLCIMCGRCVTSAPTAFWFDPGFETAETSRALLVVPGEEGDEGAVQEARRRLAARVRVLRRSVHVRHVDAGSDGSDEWEIAALSNPVYDVQRLGVYFTASPKHADVLLVTGVGAAGMTAPLKSVYDIMPEPKVVVAAGADAISGGMLGGGSAPLGGVTDLIPVDVLIPGSPPTPFGLLYGILLAVGVLGHPDAGRPDAGRTTGRMTGRNGLGVPRRGTR